MPRRDDDVAVVQFTAPGVVEVASEPRPSLVGGSVRVRTTATGISAGTELTAYRGTNPYLSQRWDADARLFVDGEPSFAYPVRGWGYSEVGVVTEVADDVTGFAPGDRVFGIWGHRAEAVVPTRLVHPLPDGVDDVLGVFGRVGAIALNAVLAARVCLGDRVAVFGQGVIGLLTTGLATLSGAEVAAVDGVDSRRQQALRLGAATAVEPDGAAERLRKWAGSGVDSAVEISGSYAALQEAIRAVVTDGRVVASGFYQGDAQALRLGEEFHHNRVSVVASQIGGTPLELGPRWDHARLNRVVMDLVARGRLDVAPLITHSVPVSEVAAVFAELDAGAPDALQVVLTFGEGA